MSKTFEDLFTEIQIDMIEICLEYAEYTADKVYVYASCEGKVIACDFFYQLNGILVECHKLNTVGADMEYDVSPDRQGACLSILNADVMKIEKLCEQYNRDMPTEIKLVYDAASNRVQTNYKYDPQYTNTRNKISEHIVQEWFEQEKKKQEKAI